MTTFDSRFPTLFHVTDCAALAGITQHGLISAERLCGLLGAHADLGENRRRWCMLDTPVGRATLRRQGMSDAALRSRLDPSITLDAWRRFINAQVFLFPTRKAALDLLRAEPARAQTIIAFTTSALRQAGCVLRFCRFNNGFIDRSPPDGRRLRHYEDYRLTDGWAPRTPIHEIVIEGGIPPTVRFDVTIPPE
ncbi:DUF7002 family protein [Plastoroseomonas arctica]|uniref:Uncharacterized protein n=1 Tax=Plastoroseomonas arctica TaxID=1509237 RepID=A0AAF1KKZ1_9PROT|nr:hypothetical protein [Plastoroseomonas arctica]MBR0654086.1 hypothetical protein [Plastoroseomonas arctica]